MMQYKMLIKSKMEIEEQKRNAVFVLVDLIKEYDKDRFMPPSQFIGENLTPEVVARNRQFPGDPRPLADLFLEFMRLRPFAEKLAAAYKRVFRKVKKNQAADPILVSLVMYLLTGYLHPKNEPYIERFISSVDLELLGSTVYVVQQMSPVGRFYYETLVKSNIYSFDYVERWYYKDERYPGFASGYLDDVKQKYVKRFGKWVVQESQGPKERTKKRLTITSENSQEKSDSIFPSINTPPIGSAILSNV